VAPGQIKPSLPRDELYLRYEFYEDLGIVKTDNIHEAKTHFSRLIDAAVNGEYFVIPKAG